jgi:predicted ribosome quality control (RQC) complex YloA/Tae2 family protein
MQMVEFTYSEEPECEPYKIIAGRNASENWKLIDNSYKYDIWLHLGGQLPSPHVFIRVGKKHDVDISVIKYAASICKARSKSKADKDVGVIYAYAKDVIKLDKPGSVYVRKYLGYLTI